MKITNVCLPWSRLKSTHRKLKRQRRCLKAKINELADKVKRLEIDNERLISRIHNDDKDVKFIINRMSVDDLAEGASVMIGNYRVFRDGNRLYIR